MSRLKQSRQHILVVAVAILMLAMAADADVGEIDYNEGMETENPVEEWTAEGEYKVNFAGLTDERSHSGKQSFKLDITFLKNGNYNYWAGPVFDIPAVQGLRFAGHLYLESVPPNVSVGLGTSYYLPALEIAEAGKGRGVCHEIGSFGVLDIGKWHRQEADVAPDGEALSRLVLGEAVPGIRFEKWYLSIICRDAVDARLVLYIDDVSVTGTVPADWEEATEQHLHDWRIEHAARSKASAGEFRQAMIPLHQQAKAISASIPEDTALTSIPAEPWAAYARELLARIKNRAAELVQATDPGQEVPKDLDDFRHDLVDTGIRSLRLAIANLRKLAGNTDPYLVFIQDNPISNYRNLPAESIVDGVLGDTIGMFASLGEYEPAGFVLMPMHL